MTTRTGKSIVISRRAFATSLLASAALGVGAGELAGPLASSQAQPAAVAAKAPAACSQFAVNVGHAFTTLGTLLEDAECRHRFDDHHAERGEADEQRRHLPVLVPARSSLALPDRVEAEHHHAGACEPDVGALDVRLESCVLHPVARHVRHRGERPFTFGTVDVRSDDEARHSLELPDLDRVSVLSLIHI